MSAVNPITINKRPTLPMVKTMSQMEKPRDMPVKITRSDYAEAIDRLAKLALKQCGGSKAAAQVVLSLYNGNNWQVNLIDLIHLDAGHFRDAIIAIRGRVEFNIEPHTLIADGDAIFNLLQDDWRQYHIKNRRCG